jgi:hypothetical protein
MRYLTEKISAIVPSIHWDEHLGSCGVQQCFDTRRVYLVSLSAGGCAISHAAAFCSRN